MQNILIVCEMKRRSGASRPSGNSGVANVDHQLLVTFGEFVKLGRLTVVWYQLLRFGSIK
jgi:hypothetical protein